MWQEGKVWKIVHIYIPSCLKGVSFVIIQHVYRWAEHIILQRKADHICNKWAEKVIETVAMTVISLV